MNPIVFQCSQMIPVSAIDICSAIADTTRWREFRGYGLLPGIESAEYENRTADMIGSRIRVRNTDGSGHVEEISQWVPGKAVGMTLQAFTPPLSYLATHFTEEWHFQSEQEATLVTRRFQMFPIRPATRPLVWLISLLFRKAIVRQLADMATVH